MKPVWILIALLFPLSLFSQEVHHAYYTTHFDQTLHEPDWVSWDLTPAMLKQGAHIPRTNKFTADPLIPNTNLSKDYKDSGYDQGHQMPAEDSSHEMNAETECFYFSNMVPQKPKLNRVVWRMLEMACREKVMSNNVTLHIICGIYGNSGTIGPDKVEVPAYCWKAYTDGKTWTAFLMPNTDTVDAKPYAAYFIDIKVLDQKLGLTIETLK
jgi:endonuclease G